MRDNNVVTAAIALATILIPSLAYSQTLSTVTVHVKIHTDNKEEPGSYHVKIKKAGKTVYEKSKWGYRENWDNGQTKSCTSDNLSDLKLPAKGPFVIELDIDQGSNIDVDHEWWIEVEDSDGNEKESTHAPREHWKSGTKYGSWKVVVK
ncbi:MAG: hypothetical protein U1D30_21935 [Planctomycetota bacterium]